MERLNEAIVLPAVRDATAEGQDGIPLLERAARAGNEVAFVQAARQIDWLRRPAADFAQAVRLALAAGAHLLARNLAERGDGLYPGHPELQKMARILAPPRIVKAGIPTGQLL